MSNPTDPAAEAQQIVDALRAGGATELRIAAAMVWIVGRAPSGALFELYGSPEQGYAVSRRIPDAGPVQRLGANLSWKAAVRYALLA